MIVVERLRFRLRLARMVLKESQKAIQRINRQLTSIWLTHESILAYHELLIQLEHRIDQAKQNIRLIEHEIHLFSI